MSGEWGPQQLSWVSAGLACWRLRVPITALDHLGASVSQVVFSQYSEMVLSPVTLFGKRNYCMSHTSKTERIAQHFRGFNCDEKQNPTKTPPNLINAWAPSPPLTSESGSGCLAWWPGLQDVTVAEEYYYTTFGVRNYSKKRIKFHLQAWCIGVDTNMCLCCLYPHSPLF